MGSASDPLASTHSLAPTMKFLFLASAVLSAGPLLAAAKIGVLFPLYFYPDVVYNDNCSAWQPLFAGYVSTPAFRVRVC
jgi:ABC-type uncharacterized transport system permease subunit